MLTSFVLFTVLFQYANDVVWQGTHVQVFNIVTL